MHRRHSALILRGMRRSLKHAAGNLWKMTVGSALVDVALKDLGKPVQTELALEEKRRSKKQSAQTRFH
jgi:hypothetical protein